MKRYILTSAVSVLLTLASVVGYQAVAAVDQPHMQAAMDQLKEAKHELEIAEADKGGHREKAIVLTKQAIEEVRAGMEFSDRRRMK